MSLVTDLAKKQLGMKAPKLIVEKHSDGFVAYPLGLKGAVVGHGGTYDEALADVRSAIQFHVETFGSEIFADEGVLDVFIAESPVTHSKVSIADLWRSSDPSAWTCALERYWQWVKPANLELERALEHLDLARIRSLDAQGWYDFLHTEYYRWKYTAPNRYATTTRSLAQYVAEPCGLELLHGIKCRLLEIDPENIRSGLSLASEIRGLGTAGASGLLSLMYPATFATVDQFVVKALRAVGDLPEADDLAKMKPQALTVVDGVTLIDIVSRKATENNQVFGTGAWTPRKIDQVLWTYGR